MKRLHLAIGLLSIGIFSCTDGDVDNSLHGSWTVISFENLTTGTIEFKTHENSWDKDINIKFDDTASPKTISGTNITNQIFGEFSFIGQNQFEVSNLGSTDVNQPRWADEFLVALSDQDLTFKTTNDRLVIYYDNKEKRVTLKRV
jgi:hypothetical protein